VNYVCIFCILGSYNFDRLQNTVTIQSGHDQRPFIHTFRSLVCLTDSYSRKMKNRRFLRDRTTVRNNTKSILLKFDILHEAKRFHKLNHRIGINKANRFQLFAGTGVGGNNHLFMIFVHNGVQRRKQVGKVLLGIHIFLTMRTYNKVITFFQPLFF